LTEQEFRLEADGALDKARRSLIALADAEGFEVELQNGVLQIEFEEPAHAKFIVSPNAPVQQIWVSAMSRGYKLSWVADTGTFALGGEGLNELLGRLVGEFLHP
jgi:CyaY protein